MNFFKRHYGLIVVLILSFWAVKPLFISGFFPIHDDTQIARVYEMGKALKDGMFPVRWVSDLGYGYGYPIFNFYAPLAYYAGGFLTLLGFDALFATKIMMGAGILLSGFFMYFLAKELWGRLGAIVASVFYVYAPYHGLDIFVRGDVSEFWAYAFIPLVFLGIYKVFLLSVNFTSKESILLASIRRSGPPRRWAKRKGIIIGAVGFAGIILSHNLIAMMVTPFMLIAMLLFIIVGKNKLFLISYFSFLILLGLAVSAFYWVPALLEMKYTNVLSQIGGRADFRDHFVCLRQLWDSPWGFGGSIPGCIDGLSFRIGKLHIVTSLIAIIIAAAAVFTKRLKQYFEIKIVIISFLGFIISAFFTLEISKPFWQAIPLMNFFQYPWRFLIMSSFFLSLTSGFIVWFLPLILKKSKYFNTVLSVLLLTALFYFNIKLFSPQTIFNRTVHDYTNNNQIKWVTSKISDEYLPKDFIKPKSLEEIVNNKIVAKNQEAVEVSTLTDRTQELSAVLNVSRKTKIKLNIAYFPAWKVFLNGKEVLLDWTKQGVYLNLKAGKHTLKAVFAQTDIEKASNVVSLIGIIVLIAGIILQKRRIYNE